MSMNFRDAAKKLNEMSEGEYNVLKYEVSQINGRLVEQQCVLYIDEYTQYIGKTWEEAFKKLDNIKNLDDIEIEAVELMDNL